MNVRCMGWASRTCSTGKGSPLVFESMQFGSSFEEMDAMSGRRQTTKGIWLALGQKLQEPKTLLLDLEGSDGRERGEDDSSFERQSSLFALAVAGGCDCHACPACAVRHHHSCKVCQMLLDSHRETL